MPRFRGESEIADDLLDNLFGPQTVSTEWAPDFLTVEALFDDGGGQAFTHEVANAKNLLVRVRVLEVPCRLNIGAAVTAFPSVCSRRWLVCLRRSAR